MTCISSKKEHQETSPTLLDYVGLFSSSVIRALLFICWWCTLYLRFVRTYTCFLPAHAVLFDFSSPYHVCGKIWSSNMSRGCAVYSCLFCTYICFLVIYTLLHDFSYSYRVRVARLENQICEAMMHSESLPILFAHLLPWWFCSSAQFHLPITCEARWKPNICRYPWLRCTPMPCHYILLVLLLILCIFYL